jgi:hypothetical protein
VKPRSATTARLPDFVEPMKAKLVSSMPSGGDWIYEMQSASLSKVDLTARPYVRALNKRDLLTLVAAVNHEPGKGSWRFASAV